MLDIGNRRHAPGAGEQCADRLHHRPSSSAFRSAWRAVRISPVQTVLLILRRVLRTTSALCRTISSCIARRFLPSGSSSYRSALASPSVIGLSSGCRRAISTTRESSDGVGMVNRASHVGQVRRLLAAGAAQEREDLLGPQFTGDHGQQAIPARDRAHASSPAANSTEVSGSSKEYN